jgi:hypothetical protein
MTSVARRVRDDEERDRGRGEEEEDDHEHPRRRQQQQPPQRAAVAATEAEAANDDGNDTAAEQASREKEAAFKSLILARFDPLYASGNLAVGPSAAEDSLEEPFHSDPWCTLTVAAPEAPRSPSSPRNNSLWSHSQESDRLDQLVATSQQKVSTRPVATPTRHVRFANPPHRLLTANDDDNVPLERLDNVTALSRSLIPSSFFRQRLHRRRIMSSSASNSSSSQQQASSSGSGKSQRGLFRRMSGRRGRSEDHSSNGHGNSESSDNPEPPLSPGRRSHSADLAGGDDAASTTSSATGGSQSSSSRGRTGLMGRLRDRSRSRSRSRKDDDGGGKEMLVAVTSCRSDGYYNQKAPGSTSKLPRKAPANLKLFHELAVGVKDAYAAVGATPRKPPEDVDDDAVNSDRVLWEFVGNLDFVSVTMWMGRFSPHQ